MRLCGQISEVGSPKAAFALRATVRPQCEGRALAKRRRGEGGRDLVKVAQYEVLGNDAKEMSVPPGTIETFGSWSHDASAAQATIYRPSGTAAA
jgi:hypothetical protein